MQVNAVRLTPSSGTPAVRPTSGAQVQRIEPQAPAAVSAADLAQASELAREQNRERLKGQLIDVEA